ncbi:MAG: hypothetical protein LBC74_11365 [Planctomycetaceae bacterium]|jgi:hypothetical protein|nr:hypothetical protein [Planctomycetaceae bacterium]
MSRIYKNVQRIPVPVNAKVYKKLVMWKGIGGSLRTGVLMDSGFVRVESPYWSVQFKDEYSKRKTVTTYTKIKEEAQRILNKLEKDVIRIRSGIVTRQEIELVDNRMCGFYSNLLY